MKINICCKDMETALYDNDIYFDTEDFVIRMTTATEPEIGFCPFCGATVGVK